MKTAQKGAWVVRSILHGKAHIVLVAIEHYETHHVQTKDAMEDIKKRNES